MNSYRLLTKEELQEDYKITEVDINEQMFTKVKYDRKYKGDIVFRQRPSVGFQKNPKGNVRYTTCVCSLYNFRTKKYITIPFAKLVFIWTYGVCPLGVVIDHIDTNPFNNSIDNLRTITDRENTVTNRKKWKYPTYEEMKDKSLNELKEMIKKLIEQAEEK